MINTDIVVASDCVIITVDVLSITGRAGNDCIFIAGGVTVSGPVSLENGDDCIRVLNAELQAPLTSAGTGADCLRADGGILNSVSLGGGNDEVVLTGVTAESVSLGNGNDCAQCKGSTSPMVISNALDGNGGDDCILFDGGSSGAINGGNDDDVIIVQRSTFGVVHGNANNDMLRVDDFQTTGLGRIQGGPGDDLIEAFKHNGGPLTIGGQGDFDTCCAAGTGVVPDCEATTSPCVERCALRRI